MLTVQSQMPINQLVSTEDPLAIRLMSQLEVLHSWASMFARLIERLESRNYDNFDVLIRSDDLVSTLVALIALTANQNNPTHTNSVISFSGLQKLD